MGTGNDRSTRSASRTAIRDAVKAISEAGAGSCLQDVGVVSYESPHRQSRYMASVAGAGVRRPTSCRKLSHLKKKGPQRAAGVIHGDLVKNFAASTSPRASGLGRRPAGHYNNLLLSAAVNSAEFSGGGIQRCPEAVPTTACSTCHDPPGAFLAPAVPLPLPLQRRHLPHRHILRERGSRIASNRRAPRCPVEIDGEPLGHTPLNSRCSIRPCLAGSSWGATSESLLLSMPCKETGADSILSPFLI